MVEELRRLLTSLSFGKPQEENLACNVLVGLCRAWLKTLHIVRVEQCFENRRLLDETIGGCVLAHHTVALRLAIQEIPVHELIFNQEAYFVGGLYSKYCGIHSVLWNRCLGEYYSVQQFQNVMPWDPA